MNRLIQRFVKYLVVSICVALTLKDLKTLAHHADDLRASLRVPSSVSF